MQANASTHFHLTGFEVGRVSRESDSEDKSGQAPTGHGTHCGGNQRTANYESSLSIDLIDQVQREN